MENSKKKENLTNKKIRINISDIHNYFLNNNITNTERDLPKAKIDKASIKQLTILNTTRNEKSKLCINLNNKNKKSKPQKININKKSGNCSVKFDNTIDSSIKSIKLYNNINYNNIFLIFLYLNNIYLINYYNLNDY